jgi:putative two-component system response regulator
MSNIIGVPVVLVVDDMPEILHLVQRTLNTEFKSILLTSGEQALKWLQKNVPDLIILDINMPNMNGYEVIDNIKSDARLVDVPIVFFSALSGDESEMLGLSRGASDYVNKPVIPQLLLHRIRTQIELSRHRHNLEELVKAKQHRLDRLQRVTINTLTECSESRDSDTGQHIKRTSLYVETLAKHLACEADLSHRLRSGDIIQLISASPLHDIGKMGIPDAILMKNGKLTSEEFDVMKTHVTIGADMLRKAVAELGFESFLDMALEICLTHHEKWDGSGYPNNIKGDEIPLTGRIMAVADVYDALTSARPYKEPFSHEKAMQISIEGREKHFDPVLVDMFVEVADSFSEINQKFK